MGRFLIRVGLFVAHAVLASALHHVATRIVGALVSASPVAAFVLAA